MVFFAPLLLRVTGNGQDAVIVFGAKEEGEYIVKPEKFMGFVDYVFRGGLLGWRDYGTMMPYVIREQVALLRDAVLG